MLRRISLFVLLVVAAGGCQLVDGVGKKWWSPFRSAEDETFAEPTFANEDDWTQEAARIGRGAQPREEKRESRLRRWFAQFEDPRTEQINRNLGY